MTRILIAYGTAEGQTAKIAEFLADVAREHGAQACPVNVEHFDVPDMQSYDAVIVGASIHMGKHERYVQDYVRENRNTLEHLPSAFFSVSLAAHDNTAQARKEVDGYIETFVHQTGWRPAKVGIFAGALLYSRYGFFTRWIMKRIARSKGSRDLDTSRDFEYTDWGSVRRFAEEFLDTLVLEPASQRAEY
jgi:menaquinone-dependent protoporphyrinogen oxidase